MDQVVKAAANFETLEAKIVHSAAEVIAERAAASINTGLDRFGVTYRVQGTDSRLSYAAVNLAAANFEAAKHAADLTATRDYLAVLEAIVTQRRALADSILASADPDSIDRRRAIVIVTECMAAESFVKSSRATLQRLDTAPRRMLWRAVAPRCVTLLTRSLPKFWRRTTNGLSRHCATASRPLQEELNEGRDCQTEPRSDRVQGQHRHGALRMDGDMGPGAGLCAAGGPALASDGADRRRIQIAV
jgi:hypothetical protein